MTVVLWGMIMGQTAAGAVNLVRFILCALQIPVDWSGNESGCSRSEFVDQARPETDTESID